MIKEKKKKEIKILKNLSYPLISKKTLQKDENQPNLHRFSINLNTCQHFVYKESPATLQENWLNLPKIKQKFYYKLYWKLLKSQIKFQKIQEKESNWIYKKPINPFGTKTKYNKFTSKRHSGYTIYGENVLDYGNPNYMTIVSNYKKLKIYYKF